MQVSNRKTYELRVATWRLLWIIPSLNGSSNIARFMGHLKVTFRIKFKYFTVKKRQ